MKCDFAFEDTAYLDEKVCDFCGRSFTTQAELVHHEATQHSTPGA